MINESKKTKVGRTEWMKKENEKPTNKLNKCDGKHFESVKVLDIEQNE